MYLVDKICPNCSKAIKVNPKRKFCSTSCSTIYHNKATKLSPEQIKENRRQTERNRYAKQKEKILKGK